MENAWFQYECIFIHIVYFIQYFLILCEHQTINIHWNCYHTVLINCVFYLSKNY